jgi:hypothetical protein
VNLIDLDEWIAFSDEGTSAKATQELEELAFVDAEDNADTVTIFQLEQDAASILWLKPEEEIQLAFSFA